MVGKNGKTYNYNTTSRLILSGKELLETEIIQLAYETPEKLICRYENCGYTDVMKNYVLINQIRYGNQVNVEFYVMPDCEEKKVPKLILQPFVENAFFHAFPQGEKGTISIFVRHSDNLLKVEIEDNGIGMSSETLRDLLDKKNASREHFTGIGVNNVDDRMKLIYGENYGILVESQEGRGTKITVCFPLDEQD